MYIDLGFNLNWGLLYVYMLHDATMAENGTGDIPVGPRWQQISTRAHPGNTRGDMAQLSLLEAELTKAK